MYRGWYHSSPRQRLPISGTVTALCVAASITVVLPSLLCFHHCCASITVVSLSLLCLHHCCVIATRDASVVSLLYTPTTLYRSIYLLLLHLLFLFLSTSTTLHWSTSYAQLHLLPLFKYTYHLTFYLFLYIILLLFPNCIYFCSSHLLLPLYTILLLSLYTILLLSLYTILLPFFIFIYSFFYQLFLFSSSSPLLLHRSTYFPVHYLLFPSSPIPSFVL